MAESLKTLRRRIRSIVNTKQITRAMEMVSAAKLRQAQRLLMEARPYARQLQTLLGRLAPEAEVSGHPFFAAPQVKHWTLVVFTADRGLCGSYNANIIRQAENILNEHPVGSMELVCIGRRGYEYFSRRNWPVAEKYADFSGRLDPDLSDSVAEFLCNRYLEGQTNEVFLLYNAFISTSHYRTTLEKYLDLDVGD